jgi:hypothetical protein
VHRALDGRRWGEARLLVIGIILILSFLAGRFTKVPQRGPSRYIRVAEVGGEYLLLKSGAGGWVSSSRWRWPRPAEEKRRFRVRHQKSLGALLLVMISLPFKILPFVPVDCWGVVIGRWSRVSGRTRKKAEFKEHPEPSES